MDFSKSVEDLPCPEDDGATAHLLGARLAAVSLQASNSPQSNSPQSNSPDSNSSMVSLWSLRGLSVVYCYPKTGRAGVAMPAGWDAIPGARGCTPQSCSYRDHYKDIMDLGARVYGLSTQTSDYQQELVDRLGLPFSLLSDSDMKLSIAMNFPSFEISGMTLLRRFTLVIEDGEIKAVHYPVFPSTSDPLWVIDYLRNKRE